MVTIDLDDFKAVNDTHGHAAGDEVLRVVAQRLRACVRAGDVVVRTGGDEFVLMLSGDQAITALPDVLDRLTTSISAPIAGAAGVHHVGASIGAATATCPTTLSNLTSTADAQMYVRKHAHHAARDEASEVPTPAH